MTKCAVYSHGLASGGGGLSSHSSLLRFGDGNLQACPRPTPDCNLVAAVGRMDVRAVSWRPVYAGNRVKTKPQHSGSQGQINFAPGLMKPAQKCYHWCVGFYPI